MKEEISALASGIAVTATLDRDDMHSKFDVFVDGKEIGKVQQGTRVVFPLNPGGYRIHVEKEWSHSETLLIEVPEGQLVEIFFGPWFLFGRFPSNLVSFLKGLFFVIRQGSVTLRQLEELERRRRRFFRISSYPLLLIFPTAALSLWVVLMPRMWAMLISFLKRLPGPIDIIIVIAGIGIGIFVYVLVAIRLWRWWVTSKIKL